MTHKAQGFEWPDIWGLYQLFLPIELLEGVELNGT